jgi:inner membrane protein
VQRHDQGPSAFAWLVAFISLVLPWAAVVLALFGLWQVARSEPGGWWYVAAAGALLIADILVDFVWAHPSVLKTDQPDLNRRPDQLVGRVVAVEEAITHGRGKVRIGDTLWIAEGPDAPAGAEVRVTAAQGAVLRVERA